MEAYRKGWGGGLGEKIREVGEWNGMGWGNISGLLAEKFMNCAATCRIPRAHVTRYIYII
jgi:hypothetical protein